MTTCPYCDQRLTENPVSGRCPHCGSLLSWTAAQSPPAGPSGPRGSEGSPRSGRPKAELESLRANLRTLANREAKEIFSAFRTSREGEAAPGAPTPPDWHFSVDLGASAHPTPAGSKRPTLPSGSDASATVEFSTPPGGGLPTPPGNPTPPANPTPPRSRPTVSEIHAGDATLEFDPATGLPPGASGLMAPDPVTPARSRATLPEARTGDATIEYSSTEAPGLIPTGGDATLAGTWAAAGSPAAPRPLSADERSNLATMWSGSFGRGENPRHTIKIESISGAAESSLVIRPRVLTRPGEPASRVTDYELLDLLGEGGMGVVYRARQSSIDRGVAVKMLRPELAAEIDQREKFLAEAVITGDLDHPNIVPIYELGANESGALFYSMKQVQGVPWLKVLRDKSLTENLEILMKVADAIAFAHSRGMIHRDLKPDNVMLGEFGEVLVMDWGIALSSTSSRLSGTIRQTSTMGGTPAYMAPEMATGPVERIGAPSDVYLLGAILYEIVTGRPPHTGRDVMSCLFAAATNEIVPTEVTGELVEIARKAMATDPAERYASVQEFQGAIRRYQSHQESVVLTARASEDLAEAGRTGNYQDFARATFALEEALALWVENHHAREALVHARLRYAECAFGKGDFDLASSLLSSEHPLHRGLAQQVAEAQREREARQQRLKLFRRAAAGLLVAVLAIGSLAYVGIRAERDRAVSAEQVARHQKTLAERAEGEAVVQRDRAEVAREEATEERDRAQRAEVQAKTDRDLAQMAREAEANQRREREYQAYIAEIGLAAAKIDENGFGEAARILSDSQARLRHWEWGRLWHLCLQDQRTIAAAGPIDSLAISPDGTRLLTGSWQGLAHVWELATGRLLLTVQQGLHVHGVAYSPDGQRFATASNDADGQVRIWDAETGELKITCRGHRDSALSVAFSHDGRRLASSSYDYTARIWDAQTGQELKTLAGHSYWVWSVGFSPDDRRLVTASQDGTVLVWSTETGEASSPFRGHQGPVYCAQFAPDGKSVASGGYDKLVLVWNPEEVKPFDFAALGQPRVASEPPYVSLAGHLAGVRTVAFSPDGSRLASGGNDNTVRLWNLADRSLIQSLRGHAGWVRSCGFTPDGQRVVTTSRDRTARIWETATGQLVKTLDEGHEFLISSADFFPGKQLLASAAGDGTTRVWDLDTSTEIQRIQGTGRVGVAALSHQGQWLATGSDEQHLMIWNPATGQSLARLEGHHSDITAIAFAPDDSRLLSGDAKGRLRLWDRESGQEIARLDGHTEAIVAVAFLPGDRALSASADRTVAQWDLATGQERVDRVLRHPSSLTSLTVFPDGLSAATTCGDDTLRIWNLDSAEIRRQCRVPGAKFTAADVSPDGRQLAALGGPAGLRWCDTVSGAEIQPDGTPHPGPILDAAALGSANWLVRLDSAGARLLLAGGAEARVLELPGLAPLAHLARNGAVSGAVFSPDASRLITASWDAKLRVWDPQTGKAVSSLPTGNSAYVNRLAMSRDGRRVLATLDDNTAQIWDWENGQVLLTLRGHSGPVRDGLFWADGTRVATASTDKTVRIWDASTGETLRVLEGHQWGVTSLALSEDARWLVSGSEDNTARVWSLTSDAAPRVLSGHTAAVTGVALSPDGLRLATASQDNTARLWDRETGQEVLTLSGHSEEVTGVRFSPSGREVLTTSSDRTAIIWLSVDWREGSAPQPRPAAALARPVQLR